MRVSDGRKQRYAKEAEEHAFREKNKFLKISDKKQKQIEIWDCKAKVISKTVAAEIKRRNINLEDKDSLEKIEEIVKQCLELKIFKNRFQSADYKEILNAVRRYLNNNTIQKEEGPLLDE